jgi:cytochrome oxidase assembly protein ShyY1
MGVEYSQPLGMPDLGPRPRFRPGWLPSLCVLLMLPLLVGLGFWQLARGEEKRALLASQEARRQTAPLTLDALQTTSDPAFRRIHLYGTFDAAHSLLLDNRVRRGQVGVEVLQPFLDQTSGRWVLVNRGWLPWPDRRVAPRFATPSIPLRLIAWVYVSPGEPFVLAGEHDRDWPRLISRVEPATVWQQLGRDGVPLELRLEPGPAALAVDWPLVGMGPEKHLGYAVQWFALAAALLALFIYFGIHQARELRDASSHRHA